jgi:hypothetical protein
VFVRGVGSKVIAVTFHGQAGVFENPWELQSEVTVGEIDDAHAARSKRTASSTASVLSS